MGGDCPGVRLDTPVAVACLAEPVCWPAAARSLVSRPVRTLLIKRLETDRIAQALRRDQRSSGSNTISAHGISR